MYLAKPLPLQKVFVEQPGYAWDLLQQQVEVETSLNIDGKCIAKLLSLYMRGVERLNSLQDKRQQFFQVRMTNLMMKPNVVKILSTPVKNSAKDRNRDKNNDRDGQEDHQRLHQNSKNNGYDSKISIDYIQRTKQMEMQIQYSLSSSTQNLNKMLSQHHTKSQTVLNKINQVKQEGQNRIQQRIKAKQVKAQIARSQSENKINYSSNKKIGSIQNILNPILEQPRSRKGSKYVKRKYSHQLLHIEKEEEEDLKPKRKFTESFGGTTK